MFLEVSEIAFLCLWAMAGSILGFFAFTYNPQRSPLYNFLRCCLSIGIGMFLALPLTNYLLEERECSKSLSIMLGGVGAFGLPDIIEKYYPKVYRRLIALLLNKADKRIGEGRDRL